MSHPTLLSLSAALIAGAALLLSLDARAEEKPATPAPRAVNEADKPDATPQKSRYPKAPATPPQVVGTWAGEWGPYYPATGAAMAKEKCKGLDCTVEQKEGVYHATFEGECGRPYKYTIKMEGRQVGASVLFKGTVDLGEQDGGVFDWVGRATDTEFVGFYTSAHYTGAFSLKRTAKAEASAPAKQ